MTKTASEIAANAIARVIISNVTVPRERNTMSMLGDHIKRHRELGELSLQDVADRAGITKPHLWELEQGKAQNPTVETVCRIAVAFGVDPKEFLLFAASDCAKRLKVSVVRHNVVARS